MSFKLFSVFCIITNFFEYIIFFKILLYALDRVQEKKSKFKGSEKKDGKEEIIVCQRRPWVDSLGRSLGLILLNLFYSNFK